jgi:glycine dehydrogenase subunit 1
VRDYTALAQACQKAGALLIVAVAETVSLGAVTPPGAMGADIVAAEGQSIGNGLNFGGPYVGLFATREKFLRQMPGRLTGETVDAIGKRGYVLTLSTREQHIRREKATSNICTNTALCAMMSHFYMCCLGRSGLKRAGELSFAKADLLRQKLRKVKSVTVPDYATFNEFVIETPRPAAQVLEQMLSAGILGGLDLGAYDKARANQILVAVTEKRSEEEIDRYVQAIA